MTTDVLENMIQLFEACQELRTELEAARAKLTNDDFEAALDGPWGDILSAAMDVEGLLDSMEE